MRYRSQRDKPLTESRGRDGFGLVSGILKVKSIRFLFWNDKLVLYNFDSDFDNASSDFQESKLSQLQKGKTTKSEVSAIIGKPTGMAIYPVIRTEGNELYMYEYVHVDPNTRKVASKSLYLLFDQTSTLIDYHFNSDIHDLPAPAAAPGGAPVPIFIPSGHK